MAAVNAIGKVLYFSFLNISKRFRSQITAFYWNDETSQHGLDSYVQREVTTYKYIHSKFVFFWRLQDSEATAIEKHEFDMKILHKISDKKKVRYGRTGNVLESLEITIIRNGCRSLLRTNTSLPQLSIGYGP